MITKNSPEVIVLLHSLNLHDEHSIEMVTRFMQVAYSNGQQDFKREIDATMFKQMKDWTDFTSIFNRDGSLRETV